MNQKERNYEIDGIRGWAAFIVIIFHFFKETFTGFWPQLDHKAFGVFFDGQLMVHIFFVLSGDALSLSFFSNKSSENTHRILLARYFRLTFPIIITCFLSYLFLKLHLTFNVEAAKIVKREDWLGIFINFPGSFSDFIKYSIEGVYLHHNALSAYNPFLWTMSIEIIGSIFVFLNIFMLEKTRDKFWGWILIIQTMFFLYFSEYLALFLFGMFLGYMRNKGTFKKISELRYNFIFFLTFVVLVFFAIPFWKEKLYHYSNKITANIFSELTYSFVYAGLVVFLIYSSNILKRLFSGKVSLFFGKISFPIYILQFNVLVTLSSWMIIQFSTMNILNSWMFIFIPIVSIVCTILLSLCFKFLENIFLSKMNYLIKSKILK